MKTSSLLKTVESGEEPADWKQAVYHHCWMHMAHHDNPVFAKSHRPLEGTGEGSAK